MKSTVVERCISRTPDESQIANGSGVVDSQRHFRTLDDGIHFSSCRMDEVQILIPGIAGLEIDELRALT